MIPRLRMSSNVKHTHATFKNVKDKSIFTKILSKQISQDKSFLENVVFYVSTRRAETVKSNEMTTV